MPQTQSGPNLTNITKGGRATVKYGVIILVVWMVGTFAFNSFRALYKALNPPPPPEPTVGFGVLPYPSFPAIAADKPTSYTLELPRGQFPNFGDRSKVFYMPQSQLSLLADEEVSAVARSLGFNGKPEILDSRSYRWSNYEPLQAVLEIDAQNFNFTLTTDYLTRPELLIGSQPPTRFDAVSTVQDYLDDAGLLAADIATSSGEITYLKSAGGQLEEAVSVSDADFVQVDIDRTPIDGIYPLYTPKGTQGVISAIISTAINTYSGIVKIDYYYHPVDYFQVHTYPIRTVNSAWEILKSGEGYIASNTQEQAVIRSVKLGFYESFEEQLYLQPIYIFEGDNDFIGYVPAVSPTYHQREIPTNTLQ